MSSTRKENYKAISLINMDVNILNKNYKMYPIIRKHFLTPNLIQRHLYANEETEAQRQGIRQAL